MVRLSRRARARALALAVAGGAVGWLVLARVERAAAPGPVEAGPRTHSAAAGARMMRGVVGAGGADAWTLRFAGGTPGRVRVLADRGHALECVVEDAGGGRQDGARGSAGACSLRWTPARGGNYRVIVRNRGTTEAPYRLVVD